MKRCSTSLAIREIQLKTMRVWRKWKTHTLLVRISNDVVPVLNSLVLSKKRLNIELHMTQQFCS